MIISKTPYRVSFFGGGTDYPEWYRREGGAVLSTAIDKYCYITCRFLPPFFDTRHRIVWSHIETVATISDILHPAVREGLRMLGFDDSCGVEIHHHGDLPARTGVGSSSSFAVGLINALETLSGGSLDKHQLALKAIELEQDVLQDSVGSQDQVAAAYGGFNIIEFAVDGAIQVSPVDVSPERLLKLQSRLLLLYTGLQQRGSDLAAEVTAGLRQHAPRLRAMRRMVDEGVAILRSKGSLDPFGELLHQAWMGKRELAEGVTTPRIDGLYETARAHGALGGKLLGVGGRGFLLFYVPEERREEVTQAFPDHLWVPIVFETDGSRIIHNDGEARSD